MGIRVFAAESDVSQGSSSCNIPHVQGERHKLIADTFDATPLPTCRRCCRGYFPAKSLSYDSLCRICHNAAKMETCCECGGDYPRVELLEYGNVFCGTCRNRQELET